MTGPNIFDQFDVVQGGVAALSRVPPMPARGGVTPRRARTPSFVLRNPHAGSRGAADPVRIAPRPGLFGGVAGSRTPPAAPKRPAPASAPAETWAQSIGHGVHDFGLGAVRGVMDVGGTVGWGADSLGSATGLWDTHAQDAVDRGKDWVASREYHPGGWADLGGRIAGNVLATAPLAEVKAFQAIPMVRDEIIARKAAAAARDAAPLAMRLVAAGRYGDLAVQGAGSGLATSGGHDVVRNMAVGAIAAPIIGSIAERVMRRPWRSAPTAEEKERIYSEAASQAVREGIRDGNPVRPQRMATNLAEARAAAGEFTRQPIPNDRGGPAATPSKRNLAKWTSGSAAEKSSSLSDHSLAAANADELYRTAKPVVRYDDPYGEDTLQIVRLRNNLRTPDGVRGVKLTVKETSHPRTPNSYYTVQALGLEPGAFTQPDYLDWSKYPGILGSSALNQARSRPNKDAGVESGLLPPKRR